MAHANYNIGVKAILKNSEGKILALKAQDNGPMAGFYDLPGGRIDTNEVGTEFAEILQREIIEELGTIHYSLSSNPVTAINCSWPNGQAMAFIYFLAEFQSGELVISQEHLGYEWVKPTPENIDKYFTSYHNKALKKYIG